MAEEPDVRLDRHGGPASCPACHDAGGLIGLVVLCVILLLHTRVIFVAAFTIAGILTSTVLVCNLVEWAADAASGVNKPSGISVFALYALAIVIYPVARVVRGRQRIDLARIHVSRPHPLTVKQLTPIGVVEPSGTTCHVDL